MGSQSYVKRLLNRDIDAQAIAGEIQTITWSIHTFMVYHSSLFKSCCSSLHTSKVKSMLAIEYGEIFFYVLGRLDSYIIKDTHILLTQSTDRIEGRLDNVHCDVQVGDQSYNIDCYLWNISRKSK